MIKRTEFGTFIIMVRPCTCHILNYLLDKSVPYVWIINHLPVPSLRWWKASVPVSEHDQLENANIRLIEYDLQMETEDFLTNLNRFENHGISLIQIMKKVPGSLWLQSLPEKSETKILIDNGMVNRFYLPHAGENARFESVRKEYLEEIITIPYIRGYLIE